MTLRTINDFGLYNQARSWDDNSCIIYLSPSQYASEYKPLSPTRGLEVDNVHVDAKVTSSFPPIAYGSVDSG